MGSKYLYKNEPGSQGLFCLISINRPLGMKYQFLKKINDPDESYKIPMQKYYIYCIRILFIEI